MRFAHEFLSKSSHRRRALAAIVAALSAGCAISASAQEEQGALEEIVVTAAKREQSLQDVPIAVAALSAEALQNAGVQNISDVSHQVPVLEVQSSVSPVMTNFRIRRVGNLGNIPTFEPAVGLFIDGAFRSRAIFGAADLYDLQRIEILRGPQSTLYGKNTTAGVIGIYTAPPTDRLSVRAEAGYGNLEGGAGDAASYQFKGGISGPLSDTFAASIGGAYTKQDPVLGEGLTNSGKPGNDTDRYSLRGQLQWDPTDSLNLRLILGTMQEDDQKETSDITYDPAGPFANVVLPAWRAAGISDTCSSNDPHDRVTCVQKPLTTNLDANEATLLARYETPNGWTLNSISSWDHFRFEGTMDDVAQMMAPLLQFHDVQESDSLQQELRLSSASGQTVEWMGGAFWYQNSFKRGDDGKNPVFIGDTQSANPVVAAVNRQLLQPRFPGVTLPPIPVAAPGQVGYLASELDTDYIGVYGQANWHLTDSFNINGGVRWQQENKDSDIRQWVNVPGPSLVSLLLSPAAVSATGLEHDTDAVTWSLTPQWHVTDSAMLFVTAAKGFKSGGFNTGFGTLPIASREFKDEDIMHYEAGVKFDVGSRARFALSAFQTTYDDYQDAAFVGGQFTVGNAERALLKGAELEGTVALGDRLTTDLSVSYADLTYDKNTHGQCYPGRASDSPTSPGSCDLSGEHPVNAPEWKTHLGLQYDQPVSWGDLFARADWSWTSEYNTSFSADPRLKQEAYDWISLRAGTRWSNYELAFWADNVTNETVANLDAVLTLYAGDGSYQSLLQPPRSYGVTFKVNF
jgi:outer membrane receptor protein involved in Fe transport